MSDKNFHSRLWGSQIDVTPVLQSLSLRSDKVSFFLQIQPANSNQFLHPEYQTNLRQESINEAIGYYFGHALNHRKCSKSNVKIVLTSLHFLSFELKNWNNICVILHYFSNQTWYFRAKKSEHGKLFAWLFLSSKQHQTVLNIQRLLLCSSERICTETFVGMATSTVLQPIIILLRCGKNSSALVTLLLGSEDSKWQWDFYSSPECNGQSGAQGKVSLLLTPRKLELACRSTTCLGIFHRWITPLRLPHISVPRLFLLFSRNNLLLNKTRLIVHCLAREKSACPRPTVDNDLVGEIYLFRSILWPKKCTL